jgi:hypothetical protein
MPRCGQSRGSAIRFLQVRTVQPPRLVHLCEQAYNPLQWLIERYFKDASEAEKRKIVRENVGQLFGFDFG